MIALVVPLGHDEVIEEEGQYCRIAGLGQCSTWCVQGTKASSMSNSAYHSALLLAKGLRNPVPVAGHHI